ncbi:uncharacterized protein LOC131885430 isoform X2 [Tigriopus californicus]|nr:uncharacterized protein LOC131885430 isoform X2 [Tigriopus californicus]XP_059089457.1 uncharacterized protein LOC131885430 isoform X2 [Tigriopus californicus]
MYQGSVEVSSDKISGFIKTADTLKIQGIGEKFTDEANKIIGGSSRRLLSVPSQHSVNSRQYSTESLPVYLDKTSSLSPRQASTDSARQMSFESSMSTLIRKQPTPPASPPRHFRKKFRRSSGCGSSSDRGNSLEDDRSPIHPAQRPGASSPAIQLSPNRQSSSSTDPDANLAVGNHAKKKREIFSARSSRSGGSNKSSVSDYSRDQSFRPLESSGSSGQSHSINQSQEEPGSSSAATASNAQSTGLTLGLTVPSSGRTLARAQSAGEATSPIAHSASKRSRFLLKRQDCTEKGIDLTTDTSQENDSGPIPAPTAKSSPNSPLMGLSHGTHCSPLDVKPEPSLHLSPTSPLSSTVLGPSPVPNSSSALVKQKSNEFLLSPPKPSFHSVSPYADSSAMPHVPSPSLHKLPAVRVTSDVPESMDQSPPRMPAPNMKLLCPPELSESRRNPLPKHRSSSTEELTYGGGGGPHVGHLPHDIHSGSYHGGMSLIPVTNPISTSYESISINYGSPGNGSSSGGGGGMLGPSHSIHDPYSMVGSSHHHFSSPQPNMPMGLPNVSGGGMISSLSLSTTTNLTSSNPVEFSHVPKGRDGPALGCNHCWNSTDGNGRILRRKTKYQCVECGVNLCIVPCFQEYHSAREREASQH